MFTVLIVALKKWISDEHDECGGVQSIVRASDVCMLRGLEGRSENGGNTVKNVWNAGNDPSRLELKRPLTSEGRLSP